MTQQIINIGSTPNDGTGDPLRTAFDKSNLNFTELYAAAIPEAPTDGAIYGRTNAAWTPAIDKSGNINVNISYIYGGYIYLSRTDTSSTASLIAFNPNFTGPRWTIAFVNQDPETGSDSGANFQIMRWHDSGGPPVVAFTIMRATGVVKLAAFMNLTPTANATPIDGDLWYDGTHLNFRHGSTTTTLV